jgi:hypothetical protein
MGSSPHPADAARALERGEARGERDRATAIPLTRPRARRYRSGRPHPMSSRRAPRAWCRRGRLFVKTSRDSGVSRDPDLRPCVADGALFRGAERLRPVRLDAVGSARALPGRRVLILGLDPDTIPGIHAAVIRAGLEYRLARFEDSDLIADQCLVALDAAAERRVVEALRGEQYDCVVVGGGIHRSEALLEFFEAVINLVRLHPPALRLPSTPTVAPVSKRLGEFSRRARSKSSDRVWTCV